MKTISARACSLRDVPILMYHHLEADHPARTPDAISVRQFGGQLDILRSAGFTTISFDQLLKARRCEATLPAKSVLITFDDGYASFFDHAMPALRARGMTATAFLVAGEIGGFNRWDEGAGKPRHTLMSQKAVEEVIASGFEIGSHGWAHRDLLACSPEELEQEILHSRQSLHSRFGVLTTTFAYPYGSFSEAHYESLARAGFQAAVTASANPPAGTGSPFAMRRACVHRDLTRLMFFLKLTPFYLRYKGWCGMAVRWRHW